MNRLRSLFKRSDCLYRKAQPFSSKAQTDCLADTWVCEPGLWFYSEALYFFAIFLMKW